MRQFLIIAALMTAASPARAAGAPALNGKALYDRVGCYQCHGYVGQGGAGTRLAPDLLPYEAFSQFVRNTTGAMPAYSMEVLPEGDLGAIYKYLGTIPQPPTVRNIPLLRQP